MIKKTNLPVKRLFAAWLLVVLAACGVLRAATIDRNTALSFAANWLTATDNPLGAEISGRTFSDIQPLANRDGATIAWVVSMNPKGFLVLSADDRLNPVVFVSADGSFKDVAGNPLPAILRANLTRLLAAVEELAPQTRGAGDNLPAAILANQSTWNTYKEQTRSLPTNVISDVYVASFVETRWSQTDSIFNYYTPTIYGTYYTFDEPGNPDNICTGCVATGTAQILRYFKWPQAPVGKVQGECTIVMRDPKKANPPEVTISKYLRGGDGNGGAYNWAAMDVYPQGGCSIETQQAIGALMLDAGLSVGMTYNTDNGNESGANYNPGTIMSLFKYSGARKLDFGPDMRASLDARRAVAITISDPFNPMSGHAIVCDGYGQMGGRWYYHMNMGWGGDSDGWYNFDENIIPTVVGTGGTSLYTPDASASIGNIFRRAMQPNEDATVTGQIISGRVVDANGSPLAGVAVAIERLDGTPYTQHMLAWYDPINPAINVDDATYTDDPTANYRNTTDARGIWAVDKVAPGNYRIHLSKEGTTFAGITEVNVVNKKNLWGVNFIATAWESELAIEKWWKEGNLVYIQFNHSIGDANIDLSKITIGGKALTGGTAYSDTSTPYLVIDVTGLGIGTGNLATSAGFLTITTQTEATGNGNTTTVAVPSTNVNLLNPSTTAIGSGASPAVTSIVRTAAAEKNTNAGMLSFTVSASDLSTISLADFRVKVISSGKVATTAPYASISSWNSTTGEVQVQVGEGDGTVRLDYVPAEGTPFISGESYYVDTLAPTILTAILGNTNLYVDITWNEQVGRDAPPDVHNFADEGFAFACTGTPGTASYKLWSKAAVDAADIKYNKGVDTIIVEKPESGTIVDGTSGTKECAGNYNKLFISAGGFIKQEIARFAFADENGNGQYDLGESIFVQLINNDLEEVKAHIMASWSAFTDVTYDEYLGDSDNSMKYAKKLKIVGNPIEGTRVYPLSSAGCHITFKSVEKDGDDDALNKDDSNFNDDALDTTSATEFANTCFNWINRTSFWVDKSKPSAANLTKFETGDTVIFGAPTNGTTGTAIDGASLYYIDINGDDKASSDDFIWQDKDGDGQFTEGTDTVQTTKTADSFAWLAAPTEDELNVVLHTNGGTVTNVTPIKISPYGDGTSVTNSKRLTIADNRMRVWLAYTPQLEVESNNKKLNTSAEINDAGATVNNSYRVPTGVETVEIRPYDYAVCDALKNAATSSTTTGELQLFDSSRPRITRAIMGYDNYSVALQFNKRIYGNAGGILGNFIAPPMGALLKDYELITEANIAVTVNYDSGDTTSLVLSNAQNSTHNAFRYDRGSNFLIIDMQGGDALDVVRGNPAFEKDPLILPAEPGVNGETAIPVYAKPVSVTVTLTSIYDYYGNELVDKSVTIPVHPRYSPGNLTMDGNSYQASLPPVMFSSYFDRWVLEPYYTKDGVAISKAAGEAISFNSVPDNNQGSNWAYRDYDNTDSDGNIVIGRVGRYTFTYTKNKVEDEVNHVYKKYVTRLYKFPYTMLELTNQQQTFYTVAPGTSDPGKKMKDVLRVETDYMSDASRGSIYNNWRDCYQSGTGSRRNNQYGVWYRDLDGDGRIDAVDLNFVNPFCRYNVNSNWSSSAELKVNSIDGFKVYAQTKDPEDYDDEENNYLLPEEETVTAWRDFSDDYHFPRNDSSSRSAMKYFYQNVGEFTFWKNWTDIDIKGYDLIPDHAQRYTTLRLHIDQNQMPPRTNGDRFILVTFAAPRYYTSQADSNATRISNCYDSRYYGNAKPLKANSPATYNYSLTSDDAVARYDNSDEEEGIYWFYSYTNGVTDKNADYVNSYFVVDSFGPVMAWDGAAAVPISATAWRATPYPKSGEADMNGFEYLDVAFTEPLAYVSDHVMGDVGSGVTNKNNLVYGPWGAQILDNNIVRFRFNKVKRTSRDFSFSNGSVYDLSGGFLDHNYIGWNNRVGNFLTVSNAALKGENARSFSGRAVGVRPIDSRYKVIGSADTIGLLSLEASDLSLTNRGVTSSTTTSQKVSSVQLKTYSQGGGFASTTGEWYRDSTKIGALLNQVMDNNNYKGISLTDDVTYGVRIADNTQPGAGFYGAIGSLNITNTAFSGYSLQGERYNISATSTFYAPDPFGRKNGYSTSYTPVKAVLSGPVYSMAKVSPLVQKYYTSRITAGQAVDVLGLNIAGSSNYKLTTVKIRVVDTSLGQFDPAIDLKPLTDDATSGVLLLNAEGNAIQVSATGNEWSEWKTNEEGLPYREYVLRTLTGVTLETTGGNANTINFKIRVVTSDSFNLGDSFYVQIPDDGIGFNNTFTVDEKKPTVAKPFWATPNGQRGFPFTDHLYRERNYDGRWAEGEAISSGEDPAYMIPLYDGGYPFMLSNQRTAILSSNGAHVKNLYYAKKNWATNPDSNPFGGVMATTNNSFDGLANVPGSDVDLEYNTSYAPGDDVWYDIGGTPGVYDEGIDIPLFGNADQFVLPYSVMESGAKSAQFRGAASASAGNVSTGTIAAPTTSPVAVVGLDMQDSGRGFGPRYILNGSIIVELISKNIAGGTYTLDYKGGATPTLSWDGGVPVLIPATANGRAILLNGSADTFMIVRRLFWVDDNKLLHPIDAPIDDETIQITVSQDDDRDIQQPSEIAGVRIIAVGRGNAANTSYALAYDPTGETATLSWAGGPAEPISKAGIYRLKAAGDTSNERYIIVQVSQAGLASTTSASENLMVYESKGMVSTPLLNITGLEIMAVSDMIEKDTYAFNYDGLGNVSWGNGVPASINGLAQGEYVVVYGEGKVRYSDGVRYDYPLNYIVLRRTGAALPASACTDVLSINQTRLFKVFVTITNVNGVTSDHFNPMSNDKTSGISLWWDANADGVFNTSDMFVSLLEAPVLSGTSSEFTTTLYPDPDWLTAWLSRPQDSSLSTRGHNFFVCVNTTEDMSFGDAFKVKASFYEPYDDSDVEATKAENVSFAEGTSKTIQCTSITNTIFSKLTTVGQTLDAGTIVGLGSIKHFFGTPIDGIDVYMSKVVISVTRPQGSTFDPDQAFTAMDDSDPSKRGILLYRDGDDDGMFVNGKPEDIKETLIPCTIKVENSLDGNTWIYTLSPSVIPGDCVVPEENDGKAEHFIAIQLTDQLPYGVSFYARMEMDAVTYNTGVGSGASIMITDTLATTINSNYDDLLNSSMVTSTTGLVINNIGNDVENAYHGITLNYDVSTNRYTLSWNNSTVTLDMTKTETYTLGSGKNFIDVTFNPAKFYREDTLVCSDTGRPSADIALNDSLTSLAGKGLTYYDANANGQYDDGETIAFAGALVYGDFANLFLAVTPFTEASGLSFFDEDKDGAYTMGESIFHDTDLVYSLPWMARLVDSDNYVSVGCGGTPAGISTSTVLVNASTVSPAAGTGLTSGLYLYYVDTNEDGRGYVYDEDYIIARVITSAGNNPALEFSSSTDKLLFDPNFDTWDDSEGEYIEPTLAGCTLCQFDAMDYLKFRAGGNDFNAYEQGDTLFLSYEETYIAPQFTWTIRVDKGRKIRWYNASEPAPYNLALNSLTAIAGLDIANSKAKDVKLTNLTVRFVNVSNFTLDDLRSLTTDINSGVQLWRDMDGNGIFNPNIDKLITGQISSANNGTEYLVTFAPTVNNEVINENVDGIYDFFVVVQPSSTANNELQVDDGDQFRIIINNTDVTLTKTLNKTARLVSGVITIDSRPPQLANVPLIADTDQDGCIETLTLIFDEKLRPGMLEDTSIWHIADASNYNAELTVTSVTLSNDYQTVTIQFSGVDTQVSTGPIVIAVTYNSEAALLDWAGNAVEFRTDANAISTGTEWTSPSNYSLYVVSSDSIVPRILHTGMAALTNNAYDESKIGHVKYDAASIKPAEFFYFQDLDKNGVWSAGEDIWVLFDEYWNSGYRIWDGGDAWTTRIGYVGSALPNLYYCDTDGSGFWDYNEFIWIDQDGDGLYLSSNDIVFRDTLVTIFQYHDRNGNWCWDPGEDIWTDGPTYDDPSQRIWNGGDSWTTEPGYWSGWGLVANYCDANGNGVWDRGEFLWIDNDLDDLYTEGIDTVIPLCRTEEIEVLDTDANGKIDAIRVCFSENINDSSMAGYDKTKDAFEPIRWTISNYSDLKACRLGVNSEYSDNQNDNVLYFTFSEGTSFDTDAVPSLSVATGETLKDSVGNLLNNGGAYAAGTLVLNDHSRPILLSAVSNKQVDAEGNLPAGTTITLTFSEPLVHYLDEEPVMGDFTIKQDGINPTPLYFVLDAANGTATLVGNLLVLTFTEATAGWASTGVTISTLAVDDTVLGDAVGNNLGAVADFTITGIDAADPLRFAYPAEGQYVRSVDDRLAVQVHFGEFDTSAVTEWSLGLYASDDDENKTALGNGIIDQAISTLARITEGEANADFFGWRQNGDYEYKLVLTLTTAGGTEAYTCRFFSSDTDDVFNAGEVVNDGQNGDIDLILLGSSDLYANWTDFAAENGLPATVSYTLEFLLEGSLLGSVEVDAVSGDVTGSLEGVSWPGSTAEGQKVTARVTAKDAEGVTLAIATSNGANLIATLPDTNAPVVDYVHNTKDDYTTIVRKTKQSVPLYASFRVSDNVGDGNQGLDSYAYRVVKGSSSIAWSEDVGKLNTNRTDYGFAQHGSKLYLFGGFDGVSSVSSMDIYDANTRVWTVASNLNTKRYSFGYASDDVRCVVAGGASDDEGILNSIEVLDFSTSTWTKQTVTLNVARYDCQLVAVGGNRFWVIGGQDENYNYLNSIEELDFSGVLPVVTLLPVTLSTARGNFKATLQTRKDSSKVVVVVGGENPGIISAIDLINVDTLACTTRSLGTARSNFAMVKVPGAAGGEDVWVIGGHGNAFTPLSSVEVIRANGAVNDVPMADMKVARSCLAAYWVDSIESVIVVGGFGSGGNTLATYEVAPRTGASWSAAAPMAVSTGHAYHSLALVGDDEMIANGTARLVAFGGSSANAYSLITESRILFDVVRDWEWKAIDSSPINYEGTIMVDDIPLALDTTYIFEVKAQDVQGNVSVIVASEGVMVSADDKEITVTILCDKKIVGGVVLARNLVFTIGGTDVTEYKYSLNGGSTWSEYVSISETINLYGLADGSYTLLVCGKDNSGHFQEDALDFTVTAVGLTWVFTPQLTTDGTANASTDYVVTFSDEDDVDLYRYDLSKDGVVQEWEYTGKSLDTPLNLNDLAMGTYTLKIYGHHSITDSWVATTPVVFSIAVPEYTFDPALSTSTNDDYTVNVDLNGLGGGVEYVLDGGATVAVTGDDPIELTDLTPGLHTLELWALDTVGEKTASSIYRIGVTTTQTIGTPLTATLIASEPNVQLPANLVFSLTFSDTLIAAPVADDFECTNGTIRSIVDAGGNQYTITVAPSPLTGTINQQFVELKLNSDSVFSATTGNGNKASFNRELETAPEKVLVYQASAVSLNLAAYALSGAYIGDTTDLDTTSEINEVEKGSVFAVQITANSYASALFQGGELTLTYATSKFTFRGPVNGSDEPDASAIDGYFDLQPEISVAGGVITMKALKAVPTNANQVFATLYFTATNAGNAATDFTVAVGSTNGIMLQNIGIVKADTAEMVSCDSLGIKVEVPPTPKQTVTFSLSKTTLDEGESADLTLNLTAAIAQNLTVTINGTDYSIEAGETSKVFVGAITNAVDNRLTGAQTVDYSITAVDQTELVEFDPDTVVTVTFTDAELDPLTGGPMDDILFGDSSIALAIDEGETASIVLCGTNGLNSVASQVTYLYTIANDNGVDYSLDKEFSITTSYAGGGVTVHVATTHDPAITADKVMTFTFTGYSFNGSNYAFATPVVLTLTVQNVDELQGDFSGDGAVDNADLVDFLMDYGSPTGSAVNPNHDLDGNGVIDFADLMLLLLNYTVTRGGVALDATRSGETVTLSMRERNGKSTAEVGDELTIDIYASTNIAGGIGGLIPIIMYSTDTLAFSGEFKPKELVNTADFDFVMDGVMPTGSLDTSTGTMELSGADNKNVNGSPLGANDERTEVLFASFKLIVTDEGDGMARLSMVSSKCTAYPNYSNYVQNENYQPLNVVLPSDLVITIGDEQPEESGEFTTGIWTNYAQTRGDGPELQFGMKEGASFDYVMADGDSPDSSGPNVTYKAQFLEEGRAMPLKWDIRGVTESMETYNLYVKLSQGEKDLTLDWSRNGTAAGFTMNHAYSYTLLVGDEAIDMFTTTSYTFEANTNADREYTAAIVVAKMLTQSYSLAKGWNLIGVPFELTPASITALDAYQPVGYDSASQEYVEASGDYAAGQAYWVYASSATALELTGTLAAASSTALASGWNLVTPLYGASVLGNPADGTTIQTVWYWSGDAYRYLASDESAVVGRGYWLNSNTVQNIWPLTGESQANAGIEEDTTVGAFKAGLWVTYGGAIDTTTGPELILGMGGTATTGYALADGDSLAKDFDSLYSVCLMASGRTEALKWDIRPIITEGSESYTLKVKVPKGSTAVTINWSGNGSNGFTMPEAYDFTLMVGSAEYDMRATSSYTFAANSANAKNYEATIVVSSPLVIETQSVSMASGWNLIGVPFDLTDASAAELASYSPIGYDAVNQEFVENVSSFTAGQAYWVYADSAFELELSGVVSEEAATSLKAGWNLVTPLYGTALLANPADGESIQTVWYWTETGYRYLDGDEEAIVGEGYWLYSTAEQSIWPVDGNAQASTWEAPEALFRAGLWTTYSDSVRSDTVPELIFGMAAGATTAYSLAEGDSLANDFSGAYGVRFVKDGRADLKWDMRAVTADSESYQLEIRVPKGTKDLTLDWSGNYSGGSGFAMPADYVYTLVVGAEEVDMLEVASYTFSASASEAKVYNATLIVEVAPEILTRQIALTAGWNLIGIPFDLTADSVTLLKGYTTVGFNGASFVNNPTTFTAGQGYWINSPSEATLELEGTLSESAGTVLKAGWNLVSPLYGASILTNPADGTSIQTVWHWDGTGYTYLANGANASIGKGYWMHTATAKTIWPISGSAPQVLIPQADTSAGAFKVGFWTSYTGTERTSGNPELIFGMGSNASAGYALADGDSLAKDFGTLYSARFAETGRSELLKWDIRPIISEGSTSYTLKVTVPKGSTPVILDWSLNGSTDGFAFSQNYLYTMTIGSNVIDLEQTTSYRFAAKSTANTTYSAVITVTSVLSHSYTLLPGWNLIGMPFELNGTEASKLAALNPMGYDNEHDAYVENMTSFEAGQAYWVFVQEGTAFTLRGTRANTSHTALKAGWNLVSPLYDATSLANPADGSTIPTVWYWTETGYRYLDDGEEAAVGAGYWLFSAQDQAIW